MDSLVKSYLVHSYLYYILDSPVINDKAYDKICQMLLNKNIDHPLITKEALTAGSGYHISKDNYPSEIIKEAEEILKKHKPAIEEYHEYKPFVFKGDPTETWLLLGLYRDYKHFRMAEKMNEVRTEIQRRWDAGIHSDIFQKYFEDHLCTPETFKLK